MTTEKEKEQQLLIDTLKFTPRTYKIQLWGYGGEKVMGTATQEQWDYCMENQVDLQDIAWNSDAAEEMGLDADRLPFPPGSWYECDDMAHVNGVSRDSGHLQVEDENGDAVVDDSLENFDGGEGSVGWCCNDEVWVGMKKKGEIVFIGSSNEKGTFFEGEIELTAPFDIEKLELHYDEVDGEEIVNCVYYNGEEIENWGGSTDGKSSDFNMVRITDDEGHWERYEPGEKDWGHPECGPSPDGWEKSPKFKFKQHKPVHVGWYNAVWSSWGTTHGTLYWNGTEFGEWEYGNFKPQSNVESWSGYNWDTSSWVNQPPEPPGIICTNKKCGWVGMSDQRIADENYDDHCPECNGTDFDWIDYDPDTAKGRKNREKYGKPWDPALALERIPVPEVKDKSNAEVECVQCDWKGLVDETHDNEGEMACPECGEPVEFLNNDEPETKSGWPFGPADTTEEKPVEESKSRWWNVKTYYKKSCEQHEIFYHDDYGTLTIIDGFRFCEYNVETNDGEFPKFEFIEVPGGNGAKDSIDMNNCYGTNIETTGLVEMFDGGCWGGPEWPDDMPEEEQERLQEVLDSEGSWALEENEGWSLSETEVWVWGPLVVTDDAGNERIIIADADGNMIDFVEEK